MGVTYTANSGKTYERIAEASPGTGNTTIDITSISQSYTDLMVVCSTSRNATGAGARGVNIYFNNDSGANQYGYSYLEYSQGSTPTADSNQYLSGQGGNAMDRGSAGTGWTLYINDYKNTTFEKNYISHLYRFQNGSYAFYQYINRWKSTAAINRITITEPFEGFISGDKVTVYGILGA